jgi:hypothetical protein
LIFIGMKMPLTNKCAALEEELMHARTKKKLLQAGHRETFERAQKELYDVVKVEEGPFMRDR